MVSYTALNLSQEPAGKSHIVAIRAEMEIQHDEMHKSVIGKMSLSVKQSLLGRLRTLLKRMHVG